MRGYEVRAFLAAGRARARVLRRYIPWCLWSTEEAHGRSQAGEEWKSQVKAGQIVWGR